MYQKLKNLNIVISKWRSIFISFERVLRNIQNILLLSPGQTRKHCCGNICDSRCFLKCFPVCPPMETLLRKQNLLPEKQKCFLANSETFDVSLCFSLMFHLVFARSGKHGETLAGNNVSATMFPSLPRALDYIYIVLDSFSVAMWKKHLFSEELLQRRDVVSLSF